MAAYLLLAIPGWAMSDHPWAWAPGGVSIFVWAAGLVLAVWFLLMSNLRWRLPDWAARFVTIAALLRFAAWSLPLHFSLRYEADNTEALEIGAKALLGLHDPYLLTTTIGNPIGPLLGGLVLAAPLYALMGNLDLQGLIWLSGGAWLLDRRYGASAAATFVVLLLCSPWARVTLPRANDNGITAGGVVLLGTIGWLMVARRQRWQWWQIGLWAALFACALVYRYTMWGAVIPLGALFLRTVGWRRTLRWFAPVAGFSVLLLTLPLIRHPAAYLNGPWRVTLKSADSGTGATAVILALVLLSVGLTAWRARTIATAWAGYAITLALVLGTMAAYSIPTLGVRGALGQYEVFWYVGWVLVFGLASLVMGSEGKPRTPPSGDGELPAEGGDEGGAMDRRPSTA